MLFKPGIETTSRLSYEDIGRLQEVFILAIEEIKKEQALLGSSNLKGIIRKTLRGEPLFLLRESSWSPNNKKEGLMEIHYPPGIKIAEVAYNPGKNNITKVTSHLGVERLQVLFKIFYNDVTPKEWRKEENMWELVK